MMCEKNSFKEVNQVSGILGERDILKFPIIKIIGGKGPITEMLIPILVRGYNGPQRTSHSGIRSSPLCLQVPLVDPDSPSYRVLTKGTGGFLSYHWCRPRFRSVDIRKEKKSLPQNFYPKRLGGGQMGLRKLRCPYQVGISYLLPVS